MCPVLSLKVHGWVPIAVEQNNLSIREVEEEQVEEEEGKGNYEGAPCDMEDGQSYCVCCRQVNAQTPCSS